MANYTGLNFHQIEALDYVEYLLWRRDAYINYLERTEEGREYLANAWRMTLTKADRAGLREHFGKGDQ